MHSYKGERGTQFHFNGDFSGEMLIGQLNLAGVVMKIPAKDVLEMVGHNAEVEDVFSEEKLALWASDNGYMKDPAAALFGVRKNSFK